MTSGKEMTTGKVILIVLIMFFVVIPLLAFLAQRMIS